MRRILLVLTVAALVAAMMSTGPAKAVSAAGRQPLRVAGVVGALPTALTTVPSLFKATATLAT